jgi:tetratricopeptide (TPR) repeat protein
VIPPPEEDERIPERLRPILEVLAQRDLYAMLGVPATAGDEEIRQAALALRKSLVSTPMAQARRSEELAWCDKGAQALLNPTVRPFYDRARARLTRARPPDRAERAAQAERAARERRLAAAREATVAYTELDLARDVGDPGLLTSPAGQARLHEARAAARVIEGAPVALEAALDARRSGDALRAMALAERAREIAPGPRVLNVLGVLRREAGDLPGSEEALRASLAADNSPRTNAPGHIALALTLMAPPEDAARRVEADRLIRRVATENEDDPYAARALALLHRSPEEWVRAHRLGAPDARQGLRDLADGLPEGSELFAVEDALRRLGPEAARRR